MRGTCFVISGPSAVGKGAVTKELLRRDPTLPLSISHTTRPPREGEVDGVDYHFVSSDEFERLVGEGLFLEHESYAGNLYGTSRAWVDSELNRGTDVILEIECKGAESVREQMGKEVVSIFLTASRETLKKRIEGRGKNSPEDIAERLAIAEEELKQVTRFDYRVSNEGPVAEAAAAVEAIIRNVRFLRDRKRAVGA